MTTDIFTGLIGTPLDSALFKEHLSKNHPSGQQEPDEIKAFPDTTFHNYHSLGISYSFDLPPANKTGAPRLAAIHFYNDGTSGYKRYKLKLALPYGLELSATGKAIVDVLGEPSNKTKFPKCCIVYSEKGVQVDLAAKDWEDPLCQIECLTIYRDLVWY
ncbi:hypothetical protein DFJ77DRAFT_455027 [Powellomyces hirtus]|nr:hypothetical protein DFJ77DRAFT_455027 [Powellomyces hirtus]